VVCGFTGPFSVVCNDVTDAPFAANWLHCSVADRMVTFELFRQMAFDTSTFPFTGIQVPANSCNLTSALLSPPGPWRRSLVSAYERVYRDIEALNNQGASVDAKRASDSCCVPATPFRL